MKVVQIIIDNSGICFLNLRCDPGLGQFCKLKYAKSCIFLEVKFNHPGSVI